MVPSLAQVSALLGYRTMLQDALSTAIELGNDLFLQQHTSITALEWAAWWLQHVVPAQQRHAYQKKCYSLTCSPWITEHKRT